MGLHGEDEGIQERTEEMSEEKENLQEETNDASITASAMGNTDDGAAVEGTAEDTHNGNPENEIIKQQQSTIDALMQRTEELTKQINRLISSGVQITDNDVSQEHAGELNNIIPDDYVPLRDLGAEIGKHDRYKSAT